MKVYDSIMDVQDCGDKMAMQTGDDPEDQDDPLAPQSGGTKDKGKQPAIAHDRNHDFNSRHFLLPHSVSLTSCLVHLTSGDQTPTATGSQCR